MQTQLNVNNTSVRFSYKSSYLASNESHSKVLKEAFNVNESLYTFKTEEWHSLVYKWIKPNETIIFKNASVLDLKEGDHVLLINTKKGFVLPRKVMKFNDKLVYHELSKDNDISNAIKLNSKQYELLGVIVSNDRTRVFDDRLYIEIV
jgi:hypothetical protein